MCVLSHSSAGLDYTQVNTVFNFPAGSTQECVPVSILDDSVVENDESFLVNGQLTNQIAGLAFVDGPATVTITDNDSKKSNEIYMHVPVDNVFVQGLMCVSYHVHRMHLKLVVLLESVLRLWVAVVLLLVCLEL